MFNNNIIIKNKYLIIGTHSNEKTNKDGGFYIINLDKFNIIYYFTIKNCIYSNCFINFKNNIFICSCAKINNWHKKGNIIYELISFQINK